MRSNLGGISQQCSLECARADWTVIRVWEQPCVYATASLPAVTTMTLLRYVMIMVHVGLESCARRKAGLHWSGNLPGVLWYKPYCDQLFVNPPRLAPSRLQPLNGEEYASLTFTLEIPHLALFPPFCFPPLQLLQVILA